jgi:hypothetical protein
MADKEKTKGKWARRREREAKKEAEHRAAYAGFRERRAVQTSANGKPPSDPYGWKSVVARVEGRAQIRR